METFHYVRIYCILICYISTYILIYVCIKSDRMTFTLKTGVLFTFSLFSVGYLIIIGVPDIMHQDIIDIRPVKGIMVNNVHLFYLL